eukprot:3139829-Rhodomonas_salina.2
MSSWGQKLTSAEGISEGKLKHCSTPGFSGCHIEVGIKEQVVGNGLEVEMQCRLQIVGEKLLGKWTWGLMEQPGCSGNSGVVRKVLHGAVLKKGLGIPTREN